MQTGPIHHDGILEQLQKKNQIHDSHNSMNNDIDAFTKVVSDLAQSSFLGYGSRKGTASTNH